MQNYPVLGHVVLGYSPIVGRQRQVSAVRLTVFPARGDAVPDAVALLRALHEVWPAPAGSGGGGGADGDAPLELKLREVGATAAGGGGRITVTPPRGAARAAGPAPVPPATAAVTANGELRLPPVALNVADEALLLALMQAQPGPHLMIEVPSFMAADETHAPLLAGLREAGSTLLLKGRPSRPLPPPTAACFAHAVIDTDEERRALPAALPGTRTLGVLQSGVRSSAQAGQAFERGAHATVGWPLEDPLPKAVGRAAVPPDVQVVLELINGVEREEPVGRLEGLLKRDPTLAFKLLRYLNSPAFGMSVEINSFGHAVMLLGYQRLKRWLALLLVSSGKGGNARPLMYAAVRRGLIMEQLAYGEDDPEVRGEMFICGVFSLLDRLLGQPFDDLLGAIPVPERVQQALAGQGGPYGPYLTLVRAIEQESAAEIREGADALLLGLSEVNHAVLRGLLAARQLDG